MITAATAEESQMLEAAYAYCTRLAARHDENFPVASFLLPRAMRPHVAAVYAFARTADDFADEGQRSSEGRHRLIDGWHQWLHACVNAAGTGPPFREVDANRVFLALGHTIRRCRLPVQLFEDLLSAFRQDITVHRYETWDEVLDYCRRSANPVGRLVLRIAGRDDEVLDRSSDGLCTALQLTNFWQDLARDWRRGRLYVPAEDWRACGAVEDDLDRGRVSDAWRAALARVAARTRQLFAQGRPVCDDVGGRLALELRLTWLGGARILRRVEAAGFDVFANRPRLGAADLPALIWGAFTWRHQ